MWYKIFKVMDLCSNGIHGFGIGTDMSVYFNKMAGNILSSFHLINVNAGRNKKQSGSIL